MSTDNQEIAYQKIISHPLTLDIEIRMLQSHIVSSYCWIKIMAKDLIEIPARTSGEPRFLVIGKISGEPWSAVITYRREKIRVISVRRSRKEEIDIYES